MGIINESRFFVLCLGAYKVGCPWICQANELRVKVGLLSQTLGTREGNRRENQEKVKPHLFLMFLSGYFKACNLEWFAYSIKKILVDIKYIYSY